MEPRGIPFLSFATVPILLGLIIGFVCLLFIIPSLVNLQNFSNRSLQPSTRNTLQGYMLNVLPIPVLFVVVILNKDISSGVPNGLLSSRPKTQLSP